MSSTTEESNWNMSPGPSRPHSLSNSETVRPQQSTFPRQSPTSQVDSSTLSTPRAGSFTSTATQIEKQLESQLSQAVATTFTPVHTQPAATPLAAIPSNPALTIPNADGSVTVNQNTAEWEAAREAVLSQMVTSQDIAATPVPKVTRGGVKTGGRRGRGGRRTKVKIEEPDDTPTTNLDVPVRAKNKGGRPRGSRAGGTSRGSRGGGTPRSGRAGTTPGSGRGGASKGGRPRGSRAGSSAAALAGRLIGRGIKRKRKKEYDDDDVEKDDTDASEEFTPIAATSSGRRINQVKTFSPVVLDPVKGLSNKLHQNATRAPVSETPSTTKKAKKRRKPGEAAVCINCGRGHSPNTNLIVFCDGCSTPWHQYCHDRPITPSFIQIEEKEWNCAECTTAQEEKMHLTGKVRADRMTLSEKRTYLRGLEKAELVSLLLHASTLHEDLPVFAPPPPPPPVQVLEPTADEEELYVYVEPDPLPYPKAGNGLHLPPEVDDLDILIDEDIVTYSHLWKTPLGWEGPRGMRWPFPQSGIGAMSALQIGVGA